MAKAEIFSGICGFTTVVTTKMSGSECLIEIETDCNHVRAMSERLKSIDPYDEISWKNDFPLAYQAAAECLPHPACPVPCGIIKAVEVEAKLALPKDVNIKITK